MGHLPTKRNDSLECGPDLPILIMAKGIANEISKEAMEFGKNLMPTQTEINWGFTEIQWKL